MTDSPREQIFTKLTAMDATLAAAGFPPISAWWRDTLRGFLSLPRRVRRLVVRVGRRGGKSSTLCRLAVAVALFGEHTIPPGDIGTIAIVSVSRDEASQRLRTIRAILSALHVPFREKGEAIELDGRPVQFKVYTASIAGVSGPTFLAIMGDEVAKWRDSDTGTNPAREVLASARPGAATQPNAFEMLSSSPWSTLDAHAEAFARGDSEDQMVAHAPTWLANPTVTEEQTRSLEPDEPTRLREYGAVPMGAAGGAFFDPDAIDACVHRFLQVPAERPFNGTLSVGIDPAFQRDAAAFVAVSGVLGIVRVLDVHEVRPARGLPLVPSVLLGSFADRAKRLGAHSMISDGFYSQTVAEVLNGRGMRLESIPSGAEGKVRIFVRLRELVNEQKIMLPANTPELVRSLKEITAKPTPNASIKIESPRRPGSHGDTVSALVGAVWALNSSLCALPSVLGPVLANGPIFIGSSNWRSSNLSPIQRMYPRSSFTGRPIR